MKLRILGDTLRVRLAQNEVTRLVEDGRVEQTIHFGPSAQEALTYCVVADRGVSAIEGAMAGGSIVVRIPFDTLKTWASGTEVSLRASQRIDDARELALLIEKDFQCLVPRADGNDADGFPNPQAT